MQVYDLKKYQRDGSYQNLGSQAHPISLYKNLRTEVMKCCANIYINWQSLMKKVITKYANIKIPYTSKCPVNSMGIHSVRTRWMYVACPASKDTSRVGRNGNFLCLLLQHCCRPRSFTCEPWTITCKPCSFESGRTGFVWVRRVWNGSADPKSRQMRGAFPHTISQRKMWTWYIMDHPPYRPDFAPSDFHLFLHLK